MFLLSVDWIFGALIPVILFFLFQCPEWFATREPTREKHCDSETHNEKHSDSETHNEKQCETQVNERKASKRPAIVIAYATYSKTSLTLAHKLFNALQDVLGRGGVLPDISILEMNEADPRGYTSASLLEDKPYAITIFIVSTFTDGRAPPNSQGFEERLLDAVNDHRVPRDLLAKEHFAVFGLGSSEYGAEHFNRFGKNLVLWLKALGVQSMLCPPVFATDRKTEYLFKVFTQSIRSWAERCELMEDGTVKASRVSVKKAHPAAAQANEVGDGESEAEDEVDEELEDMEDAGAGGEASSTGELPELLYPLLRDNLSKQGYQLVGSHSGVKLCRWTKSMLRGRGGCYKHTFYNINSSQCMEMTPSLACANKCVFCWRHHTNPVSKTFKWRQDPPDMLIEESMKRHYMMIKQFRGVPGVTPERYAEGMTIKHCALSLVGEPIMYPQINRFVEILHEKRISSFMVTNAQFPEQLRDLSPVVQLYLSIDAPTSEGLKKIDRPLHEDYWERCLQCIHELKMKKQRTVFRLTLVNQMNNRDLSAYADLVTMGCPDFIEVKGVTYCGTSNSSTLTMKENVPRHDEVIKFCSDLCDDLNQRAAAQSTKQTEGGLSERNDLTYRIACEHEHSCCVLIAMSKFWVDGKWRTWIDYDAFFDLVNSGRTDFSALDYAADAPSWAVYQSKEGGFDPAHTRVHGSKPRPSGPSQDALPHND